MKDRLTYLLCALYVHVVFLSKPSMIGIQNYPPFPSALVNYEELHTGNKYKVGITSILRINSEKYVLIYSLKIF